MRAAEANVAYQPGTGDIRVVHERDTGALPPHYRWCGVVAGDADNKLPTTPTETERLVFITFNTLVVRDAIPVAAAHRAFLAIDEYRWSLCPDLADACSRPAP